MSVQWRKSTGLRLWLMASVLRNGLKGMSLAFDRVEYSTSRSPVHGNKLRNEEWNFDLVCGPQPSRASPELAEADC